MMEEEKWKKCPFTIWDRNPSFPPLSDALGITFSEAGGRHVIAKRNIIAGKGSFIKDVINRGGRGVCQKILSLFCKLMTKGGGGSKISKK